MKKFLKILFTIQLSCATWFGFMGATLSRSNREGVIEGFFTGFMYFPFIFAPVVLPCVFLSAIGVYFLLERKSDGV